MSPHFVVAKIKSTCNQQVVVVAFRFGSLRNVFVRADSETNEDSKRRSACDIEERQNEYYNDEE